MTLAIIGLYAIVAGLIVNAIRSHHSIGSAHDALANHKDVIRGLDKSVKWFEEIAASRILKLEKAPEPDENPALPPGEVREVVRSYQNPQKSKGWQEILRAAQHGSSLNIGAAARGQVIEEVDEFLTKMDRLARAVRLHHDSPKAETLKELEAAIEDSGIKTSRVLERKEA